MSRRSKPAALAVPAKPADEAPEATPRTIEGGPTVEPDAYGIYHAANTPVGHRGSRGSRAAFTAAGTTENRAEQLLISQMQTPERHRGAGGLGGQAGGSSYLMASPLPNMSSPGGLYPSPNPVPLFQPSPKRQTGMLSPGAHQHTGFEAMFQSPMRGFNSELQAAADLLRFETPSRQAALDSLISPSPNKHARRILPGSQGRSRAGSRAAAFDVAGWRQAEEAAGLAAAGAGDDADFDLVKNLLQSPGPKEVQNLQQEHQRSKLGRSTSSTPGGSPWSASEAAAAAAGGEGAARAAAHVRRRALDFSKAEQMHRDLAVLPNLRSRGGKHGSSGGLSGLAYGAAAFGAAGAAAEQHLGGSSSSRDLDQRQQQDQKQSRFQPDLPLLPLDLSECERHNPSSTTGLTPKDPFTRSPRTKLDDAAAVVAGGAMHALQSLHGSGSEEQQRRALDPVLRSLARLPGGYSASSASKLRAAASAAAAAVSPGSGGKLPVMVPLDNLSAVAAAGAGSDIATQVLQLLQGDAGLQEQELGLQDVQNLFDDHPSEDEEDRLEQQQADADAAAADEADDDQQAAGGSAGKAAASRGRSGSAARQQRTSSRRAAAAAAAAVEQPQPSRRSRRIARSTPDAAEQRERTSSPPPRSSSGNRSRKTARRTAEAASKQQHEEQQQYEQHDRAAAAAMDVDVDQELQEEQQQQLALAAAAAAAIEAAAGAEEEDEEAAAAEEGTARTRSRSGSARKSSGKKSSARSQQQQQQTDASSQQGSDATAGDPEATAAAAAAGMAAAAGLDASALAQQAAMFPGLQTLAQLQLLQNFGVTPDKARPRLPGGLLGPGTPDEVRMAHMGLQFTGSMRSCHCKKSQCLKLYCDCFANTTYCNGCACADCKNVEANAQEVMAKRSQIQQRDPNAFTHKLAQRADTLTNRKGCKCKKSHCLKKYCECYQLGVRCGDLCKCNDCHNVGEIEGALPIPTAALLQHSALMSAASSGQQQRMQHAAAAAAGPYWPQLAQALPAVSAGAAAATPSTSLGMAQAQAQAQLLLRLQNTGQPGTPSSAPLVGGLALQSAAADGMAAEPGAAGGVSSGAATPLAAVASTPQPPKSAGRLSVDKSSLRSTAKPLLPEFMQAAAAAGKEAGGSARQGMLLRTSAAADAAAAEDQLPTPDQAGAEQHLLQMRDTSSELGPGAAAAAATAEAVVAAAAAAAAAHQQFDAAALAAMPLQHVDFAGQQQLHGLYGSPMQDPSAKLQQQQRSPARGRASASTSSGGDSRAGPVSSVPGSVTSKGRHRLAASSRACEDEASTGDVPQQQQQQQQHHALAALVSGTAAAAAGLAAGKPGGGQFSNARRQLLQQIQEEAAGVSDFSGGTSWPPEQQQQGLDGYGTPAQTAAAAAGADGSPGQAIMLGPNGPMVVLPPHVLRSAMSQAAAAAALNLTAMPSAAAADGSGEEQQAAAGVPRQTAGTLMTVTDAQGCVQFFFLPNTQAGVGAGSQQEPAADDPMLVDHSPAAAAADASRQQLCDQQEQQQQQQRMSTRHHPQPPLPPSQQQQQQQQSAFTTPTKSCPADEDDVAAAGGRSLMSSSAAAAAAAAAGGGGSCRSTPCKRTTPIKRKAEGEDNIPGSSPQQFGPSPAKLPHHLGSPPGLLAQQAQVSPSQQAQVSPSQQVVLSPVKLAARALAASGGAPEGAFSSRRPQRSSNSSSRAAQPPQQQPEMQLFLATTADGQQLLLQAPAGTDPESLIGADGSVQSCYLAAVLPSTPALASQQYLQQQQQLAAEQYVQQQQQHNLHQQQQQQLLSPQQQQQQQLSPSSRRPIKQPLQISMPAGGGTFASPSKVMSASPGKLSSPSGLLRFSPGSKTVFSPKGSSPSKPLLGSSPGRV